MAGTDLERRAQPLVAVRRRQPDVDDRDVGRELRTFSSRSSAVSQVPTTSKPCSVEQPCEALAQQDAVLGDHDAHGISARTRVPPPSGSRPAAAVERLHPVGEAAQARAAPRCRRRRLRRRRTSTTTCPSCAADLDRRRRSHARACRCSRGSRRRHSRRRPRAARAGARASSTSEPDRDRRARGELLERDGKPVPAHDRRMDPARDLAQLVQRCRDLRAAPARGARRGRRR